jgi:hypothetical protein
LAFPAIVHREYDEYEDGELEEEEEKATEAIREASRLAAKRIRARSDFIDDTEI